MKRQTPRLLVIALVATLAACAPKPEDGTLTIHFYENPGNVRLGYYTEQGPKVGPEDTLTLKQLGANDWVCETMLDSTKTPLYLLVTDSLGQALIAPQEAGIVMRETKVENDTASYHWLAMEKGLSGVNNHLNSFNGLSSYVNSKGRTLVKEYRALPDTDSAGRKAIEESYDKITSLLDTWIKSTIANNPNQTGATLVLCNIREYTSDLVAFDQMVADMQPCLALEYAKRIVEPLRAVQPGQPFIDIALPTPKGDTLRLSDIAGKGNIVLLDFWAAWCGPCRQANPGFVKTYNTFKDKGFTIYAVSLDRDADQWKNAIKEQGLTWHHVSSLMHWQCPFARKYFVSGIPDNFLLDGQGIIVARGLHGEELDAKINELLGSK